MEIAGVDVEIDVIRELPELEDLEVNPSTEDQSFNSSKYGFKNVIIKGIKGDKLDLNPSLEQQNLKGVFTEVNINPIQTKKLNATPTTQEQVISGLFDEVTVNAIEGQELNLNPSEEQQNYEGVFLGVNINPIQVQEITTDLDFSSGNAIELTAQEGVYIKKTTINKPSNLNPENIKSGETVCGIAGTNADTSDADATSDDIVVGKTAYVANQKIQGAYVPLDTSDATATAVDILKGKIAYVNGKKIVGTLSETEWLIISTIEPTGDDRKTLWYRKGKNLTKRAGWVNGEITATGGYDNTYSKYQENQRSPFISVEPNTTYTFSLTGKTSYVTDKYLGIAQYKVEATSTASFKGREVAYNSDSVTLTTSSDTHFVICFGYNIASGGLLQLEKSSTATTYEAFIEPKLFTLNENNEYVSV